MYDALRRWTLALLKAPGEPQPPVGDPTSLRVFRAGHNYLRLRLAGWLVAELFALAGIIFWTVFLITIEAETRAQKEARANAAPVVQTAPDPEPVTAGQGKTKRKRTKGPGGWEGFKQGFVRVAVRLPASAFIVIWSLKILGMLLYLAQLPLTYAVRRLDYEMRWYMVTDRSLRLRHGVWKISESTMSFANIQQVVVSQGPLQRLLGLADVKVKSAGGGGGGGPHGQQQESDMHSGHFHSVTNAHEIRDLILERLRRFREAGLGDPDEKPATATPVHANAGAYSADTLVAARELAAEARALRAALTGSKV